MEPATPNLSGYYGHPERAIASDYISPAVVEQSLNLPHTPDQEITSPAEQISQHGSSRTPNGEDHAMWNKTVVTSRGRAAGDPHAQVVSFQCQNLEDLEICLRDFLSSPKDAYPAEHTTVNLVFPVSAAFLVTNPFKQPPAGYQAGVPPTPVSKPVPPLYGDAGRTVISVMEAMTLMPDPKDNMKKQRVIAKVCTDAIERADGFRYSFHNNWFSKEDEANRFSYYCNDSILNKGRAANGGVGTIGKKVVKPVYDCKGTLHVKFSAVKQNLEVQYKHIPIHKTYDERAPPPRRDSKRRKLMELYNPESLLPKPREPKAKTTRLSGSARGTPQLGDQDMANALDGDLTLEGLQSLLGMTGPDVEGPEATPKAKPRRGRPFMERPRCTMCKSKRFVCDGGRPCNGCTERPTFCTYQDNTRDNIRARALEAEQMQPTEVEARPEPDGLPTETTPAPTPAPQKRKPKRAPAVAAAEERDVQKELGDAMNEFDRLRAQLAAAAERIQQLEQEKARVAAASQPAWNVILPADYANMRKTKENVSHGAQTP